MTTDYFKKIASVIISLLLLFAVLYGLFELSSFLLFKFPKLFLAANINIKVAVISFIGTAIVSVVTIVISKHIEKEADFRRAQYQEKLKTYQIFVDDIFASTFLDSSAKNNNTSQERKLQKQSEAVKKFIKNVILWGNDEVIHAASLWFIHVRAQGSDDKKIHASIQEMEELLMTIRKDLGHSNKKIQKGDILRLFITDYDTTIGSNNRPSN